MLKKLLIGFLLIWFGFYAACSFAADDPTLHQVYQAADSGRMSEAQAMMEKVLRDHPNSAKAHFVEAELLAKQGRFASAESEFNTAERLAPGLPFAKPQAVQNLQALLTKSHHGSGFATPVQSQSASTLPWGLMIVGLGILAAIVLIIRSLAKANASIPSMNGTGGYNTFGSSMQPAYPAGTVASPMGSAGGIGGIGSGILGGLATGAALGAGMAAGEALVHHFTDGTRQEIIPPAPVDNSWNLNQDDMGGSDFGISDSSSWDDGSSNEWD